MAAPKLGDHPNAVVAGSSAFSAAGLVTVLAAFGIACPLAAAVFIVAAVPTIALAVGRKGVRGIVRQIWRGSEVA